MTAQHLVLAASVAINCLFVGALGVLTYKRGGIGYLSARFFSQTLLSPVHGYRIHRKALFSLFESATLMSKRPIVFLGDSITEGCDWHEMFGGEGIVINRGISGDTTASLLGRIGSIAVMHPRAVFLMIGVNDCVGLGLKPSEAMQNYRAAVECIRTESPTTIIYLQSILPVMDSWGQKRNECIVETNRLIRSLADGKTIVFVDLYGYFVDSASVNPRLTCDGLHLNADGYALWREIVAPYVRTHLLQQTE